METPLWMKTFVTVVDLQSFSRAAEILGMTQSSVSRQISALERHLGVAVLKRTTRSLALTAEGTLFYEAAQKALAAIEEAETSIGRSETLSGVVRITAPLTLAQARLIGFIAEFQRSHPKIQVELKVSDHALNLVADHLDLAVRVGQIGDSSNLVRRVGVTHRVMVAAPAYLAAAGTPRRPVDLRDHNCITYALLSTGTNWHLQGHPPVAVQGNFRADSPDALRAAALSGLGIAVNARWLFEEDLASGRLVELLPDHPPVDMPIHLVMPPTRHVAARVRALSAHLVGAFQRDPLLRSD
ncbi:LysR substrate-binding domain-containing protein [Novosphingobium piscinae]|uniref:LysR family transcriptional regulator n=1 Tax=Novosphingobium piscinae TaxID=1507448 RepID=A0A7X1KQI1_9SPHN|nr:LysR family transcriptional regulator [Novosphingobium piscinae]MBC2669779.1 LysR family transcriptional regulator [Novosphingobium piscinae]